MKLFLFVCRFVSMVITATQLSQMVVCLTASVYQYYLISIGVPCDGSYKSLYGAFAMFLTYIVIFGQFFYQRYIKEPSHSLRKIQ